MKGRPDRVLMMLNEMIRQQNGHPQDQRAVIVSYTENGGRLAERICRGLAGEKGMTVFSYAYRKDFTDTNALLTDVFSRTDLLIFIGAAGIAVRQCAPFIKSKASDPAVLVADEKGMHVISLLSGHLGGGNAWCRKVATMIGADPVITTATDLNDAFAVDLFAKANGLMIGDISMIKEVSSRILRGEPVGLVSDLPIEGGLPEGLTLIAKPGPSGGDLPECGIRIIGGLQEIDEAAGFQKNAVLKEGMEPGRGIFRTECRLYAKNLWLGIGCRRGKPAEELKAFLDMFFDANAISPGRICGMASIDLKKDEQGIRELAEAWQLPFVTFSADELNRVPGEFTGSEFVRKTTGTDAVAERSALYAAGPAQENAPPGSAAKLLVPKTAADGMTAALAAAVTPVKFDQTGGNQNG